VTGECVTPASIGDACNTDEDCMDGICVQGEAVGATAERICSRTCCNPADCPPGTMCAATGTGVLLCVPPTLVGTTFEGCGNSMDCSAPDACVAEVSGSLLLTTCGMPRGVVGQGEVDLLGEGCVSGLSEGTACGGATLDCGPICVGPCSTSEDCTTSIPDTEFYCGSVEAAGYGGPVRVCTIKRHPGAGTSGASCTTNAGCRDLTCLDGRCADSCCSNGDCATGMVCRPLQIRGHWETHCI
jgi:hypothetical protein